jgi:hypothetical protein
MKQLLVHIRSNRSGSLENQPFRSYIENRKSPQGPTIISSLGNRLGPEITRPGPDDDMVSGRRLFQSPGCFAFLLLPREMHFPKFHTLHPGKRPDIIQSPRQLRFVVEDPPPLTYSKLFKPQQVLRKPPGLHYLTPRGQKIQQPSRI